MSEILVGTIEPATHELGLSKIFVGVFVSGGKRRPV